MAQHGGVTTPVAGDVTGLPSCGQPGAVCDEAGGGGNQLVKDENFALCIVIDVGRSLSRWATEYFSPVATRPGFDVRRVINDGTRHSDVTTHK